MEARLTESQCIDGLQENNTRGTFSKDYYRSGYSGTYMNM